MAIRITGMYSGLDTESIINELASAQSYKKNKMVKAQTKLSWKQDAWKSLNTKIYGFYQKLDDLRLQSSYLKKKTVVSNPNAIQVTGSKTDGSHKVSVERLSQQAVLTSGSLAKGDVHYTGAATLKQLGFSGTGSIRLSDAAGNFVSIDVNENMKIDDFVKAVGNNTALKASFDQDNQRIFLSSWTSGKEGEFFLTGNDEGGVEALKALKLLSSSDLEKLTDAGGEYNVWSKYVNADLTADSPSYSSADYTADYWKLIKEEALRRVKEMKAENDQLEKSNKGADEANQKNRETLKRIQNNVDNKYTDYMPYVDYNDSMSADEIVAKGKALYEDIYGVETQVMEDGNPKVDKDGKPVMERTGGMMGDLKTLQKDLETKQEALKQARKDLADGTAGVSQADVDAAEAAVTAASQAVSEKQAAIGKAQEVYDVYSTFEKNEKEKTENLTKIAENNAKFKYTKNDDGTEIYEEKDASGNAVAIGQGVVSQAVAKEFDERVKAAQKVMNDVRNADGTLKTNSSMLADAQGTKVSGEDAKITVDGVSYTSATDTLTVNGMTITALEQTDKEVTVTTKTDTDGVYNMIKDFIKSYSELINEMDSLYNAESSKGYDPLLTEEKEALTDTEIEEWEKKIKDSLLRRDSTLRDISSSLKMDMMSGFSIQGQMIYLSDFGIATLGYFGAEENERNAYHIDGDPDDPKTKNNTDKLNALINKNPDAVMEFFTSLTDKLHDTLANKMSATSMSSALTVYNDKKMKEEYNDYTDKIKKQEDKLNAYIDNWYAKFSKMETALSKLESKNSSLSSLFGG